MRIHIGINYRGLVIIGIPTTFRILVNNEHCITKNTQGLRGIASSIWKNSYFLPSLLSIGCMFYSILPNGQMPMFRYQETIPKPDASWYADEEDHVDEEDRSKSSHAARRAAKAQHRRLKREFGFSYLCIFFLFKCFWSRPFTWSSSFFPMCIFLKV